jgi:pimeloyl-ACP methyl ester carboxylesterase
MFSVRALVRATALALFLPVVASAQAAEHPPFTVKVSGSGRPMILIPGLTNTGEVWTGTVAEFSRDHQVHVLSLAGFGGTPAISADSNWLGRQRDAIVGYIRAQRLEKPVIVGHSLGGVLALWIASSEPALLGAVVNVDGLPFLGATMSPAATIESVKPQATQMRAMMSQPNSRENYLRMQDQQVQLMTRDSAGRVMVARHGRDSDMPTIAAAMYEMFGLDLRPELAKITVPVLNVHAWAAFATYGQTRPGAEAMFTSQYANLSTGRLRIHDQSYHFIMLDESAWLHAEMRDFLRR